MKKSLQSLILLPIFLFTFIYTAHAQTGIETSITDLQRIGTTVGISVDRATPGQGIAVIVGGVIEIVLSILGVIFLTLTVYGGWIWMTAAGNQEKVDRAKTLLRNSIIGLAIIIASFAITKFVIEGILNASSSGSSTPTP